jgi:acetylornithine deacetylase
MQPASIVDFAHPIVEGVAAPRQVATEGTPYAGPTPISGFAAVEDTSFLNAEIPAISLRAAGIRVAHADDEYVMIDELSAACRTYALTAVQWCDWEEG